MFINSIEMYGRFQYIFNSIEMYGRFQYIFLSNVYGRMQKLTTNGMVAPPRLDEIRDNTERVRGVVTGWRLTLTSSQHCVILTDNRRSSVVERSQSIWLPAAFT